MEAPAAPSWAAIAAHLRAEPPGDELDDAIDAAADRALEYGDPAAVPALVAALGRARSQLSRRSAAFAIAALAGEEDGDAVDALCHAHDQAPDPFTRRAVFEAISLLATRNARARAECVVRILRGDETSDRYWLMSAARAAGRLHVLQAEAGLVTWLRARSGADDLQVQGEARQQLALIELGELLLVPDFATFAQQATAVRAAFARARSCEEVRSDADMFIGLLDLIAAFVDLTAASAPGDLLDRAIAADGLVAGATGPWPGYWSPVAALLAARVRRVSAAFRIAAGHAATAKRWLELPRILGELASAYAVVRWSAGHPAADGPIEPPLAGLADRAFAPAIGPLLAWAATHQRVDAAIELHLQTSGDDATAAGLRALAAAMPASPEAPGLENRLAHAAALLGTSAAELVDGLDRAVARSSPEEWLTGLAAGIQRYPEEPREPYGADPNVDETVRAVLVQVWRHLGPTYPIEKWRRVAPAVVQCVQFVQSVRDAPPPYLLCAEEEGGKGVHAIEADMQTPLVGWLRVFFPRAVSEEKRDEGGGRVDVHLRFTECDVPIDVKRTFAAPTRERVRDHYLAQSDVHGAGADRFSVLLLMDLRESNAAGHRTRRRAAGRNRIPPHALYRLEDGFWVDHLDPDPEVDGALPSAVVVGLVPGNRPRPSSYSDYGSPRSQKAVPATEDG